MKSRLPLRGLNARLTCLFFGLFLGALFTSQTILMSISFLGFLVFYVLFYNSFNEN